MPGARRFAAACAALILLCASAAVADEARLSLGDARRLAAVALSQGNAVLARDLAMGLLKADPEDAYAYAVLARAHSRLGDDDLARAAARLSYRYAEGPGDRYRAARDAGRLAYVQKRPTMAQIWLRRAAIHAKTPAEEEAIARDYRAARNANPWRLRLDMRVAPSDNVNNGADSALEIINGEPTLGQLGPSSMALSGTVGIVDLSLGYRVAQSDSSVTWLGHRLYTRQVWLSDSAKRSAPDARNDDYGSTYADISIDHIFKLGAPGNSAGLGAAVGAAWSSDERSYNFLQLRGRRSIRLSDTQRLHFTGGIERRDSALGDLFDQQLVRVGVNYSHELASGDSLTLGVTVQDINSDFTNYDYRTGSFRAEYGFARALGPAEVSAGITVGRSDYSQYQLLAPIEGGREDNSVYGDVSFFFRDYDFAGFAPTVRLRSGRRDSNISRFETRETSLSFEIGSKF